MGHPRLAPLQLSIVCLGLFLLAQPISVQGAVLNKVSVVEDHPKFGIVLVETNSPNARHKVYPHKTRQNYVELELSGVTPGKTSDIQRYSGAIEQITVKYDRARKSTRLGITFAPGISNKSLFDCRIDGSRTGRVALIVDLPKSGLGVVPTRAEAIAYKERGYRIIIVDPGHGWIDPGATHHGMQEKTVVSDISKRLVALINQSKNMRAYLTRSGDYLPLMEKNAYVGTSKQIIRKALQARIDFAREMEGDVFVSLHLNATSRRSRYSTAKGFEIYYLAEKYVDQVLDEGIVSDDITLYSGENGHDAGSDDANSFLEALKRDSTVEGNKILAQTIATSLRNVKGLQPRERPILGHRFRVLRSLAMPTVLVEMAFLTNRDDAAKLKRSDFRGALAWALYNGIANYFSAEQEISPTLKKFVADTTVPPPTEKYPIHVVEQGENLFTIARLYGTTGSYLQKINKMGRKTLIIPGRELKVPEGSETMTRAYTVRKGDSLSKIATKHGMTTTALRRLNPNCGRVLHPGDKLVIASQGRRPSTQLKKTATAKASSKRSTPRKQSYRVRKGDSLYTISRRYHTTIGKLKSLNGLRSSKLKPGQVLRVR